MVTDESICPSLKCVTQCLLVQSSLKSLIFCPSLKCVTQCLLVQSSLKSLILSVFSDATKIRPIRSLYYDLYKGKQQRQRTPRKNEAVRLSPCTCLALLYPQENVEVLEGERSPYKHSSLSLIFMFNLQNRLVSVKLHGYDKYESRGHK